jgi:uncharacterized protein (DUF2147 family)
MKRVILLAAVLGLSVPAAAQTPSVMGTWMTPARTAQVRLAPCPDTSSGPVCGSIVSLTAPKGPDGVVVPQEAAIDIHNADPALRSRKILGATMLYGFKPTSTPNTFEDGNIYNAENGKTYRANIALQPDGTLRLRGYVGTPMLGETQVWTRVR